LTIEVPGIIGWIIVGLVAGWLASTIMKRRGSLITNVLLGLVGAIVGGVVFSLLGFHSGNGHILGSILVATVGAILILAIVG
jgi:uncharacterized membrane protein YeaQ/YmgE (transglycosylase-associated protein family)